MAKLGFTLYGQGKEKVVVYNDWMGDCSSWLPTQPFLDTDTFTYAFIDVRGYGRSLHLQGEYTAKEIVADTLELLETLGWDTFHVIGFSMTGIVTHRMAIDIPERIKSAVAIGAVSAECFKMPDEFKQLVIDSITNDDKAIELFNIAFGKRLSSQWQQFKWRESRQTRTPAAARGYLEMFTAQDFSYELERISLPFLIVCGKYDLEEERIDAQKQRFNQWHDNIEFVEIESGHYPMQETPVILQTVMESFMKKHIDSI
ncbi:Pimelyl-[acyl-carrier protein] methyl ester esterase [Piscirickettsia salmonis]|uniref:alpha/beta fold hydrolase n=1 Tax=Piscirickettsia salmonis TaxID=1238 RepID=UPI0012B81D4C|nr:alpha/beta hydrolase [Piscirickettsia salmonis]QGP50298.1 Pimelyl-[acyl-carrier protein] methyl ester esterase [Piscirickettsia salmonis]